MCQIQNFPMFMAFMLGVAVFGIGLALWGAWLREQEKKQKHGK